MALPPPHDIAAGMHTAARRAAICDEPGQVDARPMATGGCAPVRGAFRAPVPIALSASEGQTFPAIENVEDAPGDRLARTSTDANGHETSCPSLTEAPDGNRHLACSDFRRAINCVERATGRLGSATGDLR